MSKAGSFTAYLQYTQRDRENQTATGPASLLALLSKHPQPDVSLTELADLSGLNAGVFRDALRKLVDSDFVLISGTPLQETVTLTAKGRAVATVL